MSFKAEILPKAHDEKNARRGYPLSVWGVVATANPFCDLPWVRRGRMSCKAKILPKAHDEKNARRGYPLQARVAPTFRSAPNGA
jgi:hypothetical protein